MTTSVFQTSFAAGELSSSLYARVDLAKYKSGAQVLRNFFVDYRGGAPSRAGTRYIATSATPGTGLPPRLVPFQFNTEQTYVLEFGAGYIAFYKDGAQVQVTGTAYTIGSPYALADLPLLKSTQSADVKTFVHTSYQPRNLNRFGDTNWTLPVIMIAPVQQPPAVGSAVPTHGTEAAGTGDAETTTYTYVVTAVSQGGEESEPCLPFGNPGDSRIMSQDGNAFITLAFGVSPGTPPAFYNIYRQQEVPNTNAPAGSIYGLVGSSNDVTYVDRNGQPDFTTTPPSGRDPFASNNPGVTTYFGQRQWYAASLALPETLWASKIGAFTNFDVSQPVQAADAITATIASTQVNAIKHMTPMSTGIVVFSSGGAWLVSGGSVGQGGVPGPVTPASLVAQPQAYNGCSDLPPIVADYDILYGPRGGGVRDLSYNFYVNIYTGTDMTVLSNHLFIGHQIREWAFAEEPYRIVWAVRDDGILLSFTYVKDQEVYAWTHHDTNGLFQSVCVVSEGQYDAVYFVVRRKLQGIWRYTIERMAERWLVEGNDQLGIPANIENSWCVDCGLQLTQPAPAASLDIDDGGDVVGASLRFLASGLVFAPGDVGKIIRAQGGQAVITAFLDASQVQATVRVGFPVLPNDPGKTTLPTASGLWTMTAAVNTISLPHLAGKTIGILADGNVLARQVVPANGVCTLPVSASSIVAGLPYQCQIPTLRVHSGHQPGGTIAGKMKKIGAVTLRVKNARGLKTGRLPSTVVPVKEWSTAVNLGGPLPLVTGDERVIMDPKYDEEGQFWIQLDDPVPATVLGIIPELTTGG